MKKIAMMIAVAPFFLSGALAVGASSAAGGTINFSGALSASTCNVAISGASHTSVTLPTLAASTLDGSGKVGGQTPFNIQVTGCSTTDTSVTSIGVKAYFEHTGTSGSGGRLVNSAADGDKASNVEVELLDGSQSWQPINIGDTGQNTGGYVSISNNNTVLPYAVRYYATGVTTAGLVQSNVTFNLIYN